MRALRIRTRDSALANTFLRGPDEDEEEVAAAAPAHERSKNELRPATLDDLIGQGPMKALIADYIAACERDGTPFDHTLLVGSSGTGKTTIANIIANELQVQVFQVEAPISHETLLMLRPQMRDRDIIFIDEIHQQAMAERRGMTTNTRPEVLFGVMEDQTLVSDTRVVAFPAITVIGATTDEGLLPDAFVNRFPVRPQFDPYSAIELGEIACMNADTLKVKIDTKAALRFAHASRGVPRQINNYVKNAARLADPAVGIDEDLAVKVIRDLNRTTLDGLTLDMQKTLVFLYDKCQRTTGEGEIVYQASVNSIATAIGKSRDTKAVALRVEPYLIEQGYLQVGHGGRRLTDRGVRRAHRLMHRGD